MDCRSPSKLTGREAIASSLDAAAASGVDLVPIVYARLFAANPEAADIFSATPGMPNPAMGNMVNGVIELIADGIDRGDLHSTMSSTLTNHAGWGIDVRLYRALLDALIATVRDASGELWSDDMAATWRDRSALIINLITESQGRFD